MAFVIPDYIYTILLACVMGACTTEEDCNDARCICKPSMYVDQSHPTSQLEHHICNNATFDWLVHTMLAEIATQKETLASNKEYINNLKFEVEAYEMNHADLHDKNNQLQDEISQLMEERSHLAAEVAMLQGKVLTLEEEVTMLNRARRTAFPRDCADVQQRGSYFSGLYTVYPLGAEQGLEVFCDLNTDGGGWTVFQRRVDGSQRFDQTWEEYKKGFGKPGKEFWLGNEMLHLITNEDVYELRVDLVEQDGSNAYATYESIRIENEENSYKLRIGAYKPGNAGDALSHHDGMMFSSIDVDNDLSRSGHCSQLYGMGGWWFARCYDSNLNGMHTVGESRQGIIWYQLNHDHVSLKHTEMKIRPQDFRKQHTGT